MYPVLDPATLSEAARSVSCTYTGQAPRRKSTTRRNRKWGHLASLLERDGTSSLSLMAVEAASGHPPEPSAKKLPEAEARGAIAGRGAIRLERDSAARLASPRTELLRFANWLCRDPVIGEGLVQETLFRAPALSKLDPPHRDPLIMQVVVGCSVREVAEEMGLTPTATLTRLWRARSRLRLAAGLDVARKRDPPSERAGGR
jgi:hypothetical protein